MICSLWLYWCLFIVCFIFFFFKQKTAYEMRISDWSSDVCSSDLADLRLALQQGMSDFAACRTDVVFLGPAYALAGIVLVHLTVGHDLQIGRASCRERVCQYV